MGFRLSSRVRTVGIATVLLAVAVTVPAVAAAPPHTAKTPTISSVQQQLSNLAARNDQLVEKYNQANIAYASAQRASVKASAADRVAAAQLAAARSQLSASATAQYEGGSFSAAGALLSSDSGSSYLDQLDTLTMLSSHNSQVVSSFAQIQTQAKAAKVHANLLYRQASAKRANVLAQRTQTRAEISKYTKLLSTLNAAQRAAYMSKTNPTVAQPKINATKIKVAHISSAAARIAVTFALHQVNKPYVYGSGGPNSYDCSGLTMASYAAAGISLPHSAADQYNYGHHVAFSDLQPGDLMFFYHPRISHVTIYIGNGLMVSAPETGELVKVLPATVFGNLYVGATRLVG